MVFARPNLERLNSSLCLPCSRQMRWLLCFCSFFSCCFNSLLGISSMQAQVRGQFKVSLYLDLGGFLPVASLFQGSSLNFQLLWQPQTPSSDKPETLGSAPVLAAPCCVDWDVSWGEKLCRHGPQPSWFPSLQISSNFYLTLAIFLRPSRSYALYLSRVYNCYLKES